jgi:hypothetical protein
MAERSAALVAGQQLRRELRALLWAKDPPPSDTTMRVFDALADATLSYGKLGDVLPVISIGQDWAHFTGTREAIERRTRRSLSWLRDHGVISYPDDYKGGKRGDGKAGSLICFTVPSEWRHRFPPRQTPMELEALFPSVRSASNPDASRVRLDGSNPDTSYVRVEEPNPDTSRVRPNPDTSYVRRPERVSGKKTDDVGISSKEDDRQQLTALWDSLVQWNHGRPIDQTVLLAAWPHWQHNPATLQRAVEYSRREAKKPGNGLLLSLLRQPPDQLHLPEEQPVTNRPRATYLDIEDAEPAPSPEETAAGLASVREALAKTKRGVA